MLKNFFLPTVENNHTPYLLNSKLFVVYLIALILLNIFSANASFTKAEASVDFTNIFEKHNETRAQYGLGQLSINTQLNESATQKAKAMLAIDCWSHYCPEGVSPWTFFDDAGYIYIFAGENLAEGFDNNENVMSAWMNSPTHRENILNPNFDEMGIGFAYGDFQGIENNTIVVVHFGSRNDVILANDVLGELPETGESAVNIYQPREGEIISELRPNIEGKAPVDSNVEIYEGSTTLGNVDAQGENFTYRPEVDLTEGQHTIAATAYDDSGRVLASSDYVNFTIDVTSPDIFLKSLEVTSVSYNGGDEIATLEVDTIEDTDTLILEQASKPFLYLGQGSWSIDIDLDYFRANNSVVIVASDKAGNITREEIGTKVLLAESLALLSEPLIEDEDSNLVTNFVDSLNLKDTRSKVNIGFMVFLIGLFIVDFTVLAKSGMTGVKRSKSHLHLSSLIILLVIALIGGMSGSVLTGISD